MSLSKKRSLKEGQRIKVNDGFEFLKLSLFLCILLYHSASLVTVLRVRISFGL